MDLRIGDLDLDLDLAVAGLVTSLALVQVQSPIMYRSYGLANFSHNTCVTDRRRQRYKGHIAPKAWLNDQPKINVKYDSMSIRAGVVSPDKWIFFIGRLAKEDDIHASCKVFSTYLHESCQNAARMIAIDWKLLHFQCHLIRGPNPASSAVRPSWTSVSTAGAAIIGGTGGTRPPQKFWLGGRKCKHPPNNCHFYVIINT